MKFRITGDNEVVDRAAREFARQKLEVALARFAPRIRDVDVTLIDLNGPRGGVDKRCRVVVHFVRTGSVSAEVTDSAFEPAVHRAADRLVRRIREWLRRKRDSGLRGEGIVGGAPFRRVVGADVDSEVGPIGAGDGKDSLLGNAPQSDGSFGGVGRDRDSSEDGAGVTNACDMGSSTETKAEKLPRPDTSGDRSSAI